MHAVHLFKKLKFAGVNVNYKGCVFIIYKCKTLDVYSILHYHISLIKNSDKIKKYRATV